MPRAFRRAPRRIALSGWSAGYGAVFRVLDRERDAVRVDAVLLADGLHASLDQTSKYERHVSIDHMAPFTAFADEASSAIGFTTRRSLQQTLDARTNSRLHLDPANTR